MKGFAIACAFSVAVVGCGGGGGGDHGGPPPDVSGTWVQDQPRFVSSNCVPEVDAVIATLIDPTAVCAYQVSQSGNSVTVTNCHGTILRGGVNGAGVMSVDTTLASSEAGCSISATVNLAADLSHSPTIGRFTLPFRFSGCGVSNCTAIVDTRWAR